MGKKATYLLFGVLLRALVIVIVLLSVTGWLAGIIPPQKSWFVALVGLGMTPLLIFDAIAMIVALIVKRWWLAIICLGAIVLNSGYVASMFQFDFRNKNELAQPQLKIGSYNIHGYGQRDFDQLLEQVLNDFSQKKTDIVCFQEFFEAPGLVIDSLRQPFPHHVILSQTKGMQLAVFSKYPIEDATLISFSSASSSTSNNAMKCNIDVNGHFINLINVHFQTTNLNQSHNEIIKVRSLGVDDLEGKEAFDIIMDRLSKNAQMRTDQVSLIRHQIDSLEGLPVIICGDFNDTPASFTYRQMKKKLNDGFRTCGNGYAYTFDELFRLLRLDYIFYSDVFEGISFERLMWRWSDHYPVVLELKFNDTTTDKK